MAQHATWRTIDAMASTQEEVDQQPRRQGRRLVRFSVRTLLILLTLLCVWLGVQVHRARHQKNVTAAILDLGGSVRYDWQPSVFDREKQHIEAELAAQSGRPIPTFTDEPRGPEWLRELIGAEYFQQIAEIQLVGTNVYTDRLKISNELLNDITSLDGLEGLVLTTTDVSDAELQQIAGLKKLRYLLISNAPITDSGLVHLRSLRNLAQLGLYESDVTEEGVKNLQEYLPDCKIGFSTWSVWRDRRER